MSAGLATKANGQAALWLNGQPGWHRLGTVWKPRFDGDKPTVEQIMEASGLDYLVEKRPMFVGATADSVMGTDRAEVGQNWGVVRTDTNVLLGTVGNVYKEYQNYQAFDFLNTVTRQEDASFFESAGQLKQGARVFVTMQLGPDIVLDPNGVKDAIKRYLIVTHSHDGTGKITGAVSPMRVVCTNTLTAGLNIADYKWEVKHTENAGDRLALAASLVVNAKAAFEELELTGNRMLGMKMTNATFDKFLKEIAFPIKDGMREADVKRLTAKQDEARELFRTAKTQESIRGTRWAAYNALTEQIDHFSDVRVPRSLRLDESRPLDARKDIARAARLINQDDAPRKVTLTKQLLTWGV